MDAIVNAGGVLAFNPVAPYKVVLRGRTRGLGGGLESEREVDVVGWGIVVLRRTQMTVDTVVQCMVTENGVRVCTAAELCDEMGLDPETVRIGRV